MSEWKEYRLNELGTVVGGATPSTMHPEYYDGSIPWITPKDLTNWKDIYISKGERSITEAGYKSASCKIMPRGSVLFSSRAPIGYIAIAANDICTNQGFKSVVPNPDLVESVFLYYSLLYNRERIKALGSGTTFAEISGKVMSNVCIRIPSLQEQRAIASILSSLDSKIENNRKICANLEAQAQALFKHWFIDFAPFKDGKFVESELGMIPEGWRVGTLSDYVDNLSGYSYKGSELQPSSIAMATIKNFVRGGGFKTEGYKEIVISKVIKDYQYVNQFDVLVAHTDLTQNAAVVGNPAIVLSTAGYDNLIMSMDLTKVVSKDKRLTSPLIHSILSTRRFKEHALGYVNGTTVLHMSKKAVPEYKLAMPINLDVFNELTSQLNDMYQMMSETYDENLLLSTLRDTLLPKLMSGAIKV